MIFYFILFIPLSLAAPSSSVTAQTTNQSHTPLTGLPSTHYHPIQTSSRPSNPYHPVQVPPRTSTPYRPFQILPTFTPAFTRPHNPTAFVPIHTSVPDPLVHSNPSQPSQKPIIVVFEVLSGLLISGLLLGLLRCCYKYKTGPKRDRIAEVVSRHHLQRELEEIERNPLAFRRGSIREPAPPYFPPPPSYSAEPPMPPVPPPTSEVSTRTPPSSRPQSQQTLHTLSDTNQLPSDSIPVLPSG